MLKIKPVPITKSARYNNDLNIDPSRSNEYKLGYLAAIFWMTSSNRGASPPQCPLPVPAAVGDSASDDWLAYTEWFAGRSDGITHMEVSLLAADTQMSNAITIFVFALRLALVVGGLLALTSCDGPRAFGGAILVGYGIFKIWTD